MNYVCDLSEKAAQPILSIRAHTTVENMAPFLGEVYGAIMQHLDELGEEPAGAPFAIYYNMDMQNLDIEAGFPVRRELPGVDTIQPGFLPAGEQVSLLHTGPYDTLPAAYEALSEYARAQGRQPTGVAYEFYLKGPMDHPAEELETVIVFPLQGKQ